MRKLHTRHSNPQGQLRYSLRSSLRSSRRCFSYALNSAFISACAPAAHVSGECRSQVQRVWNHPGLARRLLLLLLLLLLALARLLESGPFTKGHDLLEVENQ